MTTPTTVAIPTSVANAHAVYPLIRPARLVRRQGLHQQAQRSSKRTKSRAIPDVSAALNSISTGARRSAGNPGPPRYEDLDIDRAATVTDAGVTGGGNLGVCGPDPSNKRTPPRNLAHLHSLLLGPSTSSTSAFLARHRLGLNEANVIRAWRTFSMQLNTAAAHAERAAQVFRYPARCKSPMNASWLSQSQCSRGAPKRPR